MGFKLPWGADAAPAYDGPITLTPDGGPFLYNDAVPYEMLLAAGVIIPSWLVVYAVMHALLEVKLYDAKKGLIKAPTLAERIDALNSPRLEAYAAKSRRKRRSRSWSDALSLDTTFSIVGAIRLIDTAMSRTIAPLASVRAPRSSTHASGAKSTAEERPRALTHVHIHAHAQAHAHTHAHAHVRSLHLRPRAGIM